jgi:hypothetical protein
MFWEKLEHNFYFQLEQEYQPLHHQISGRY